MKYTTFIRTLLIAISVMTAAGCKDSPRNATGPNGFEPITPAGEITYNDGTVTVPGAKIIFRGQVFQDSAEIPIGTLTAIVLDDSVFFFFPKSDNESAELTDSASCAAFAGYILSRMPDVSYGAPNPNCRESWTESRTLDEQWRVGTGLDVETVSSTMIRATNTKYRWAAVTSEGNSYYLKPPEPLDIGMMDILQAGNLLDDPNPQHMKEIPYVPLVESYGSTARLGLVECLLRTPVPLAWESQSYWEALQHNPSLMRSLNRLEWAHITLDLIQGIVGTIVPYSSCVMVALEPSVLASVDALIDYHEAGGRFEDYQGSYSSAVMGSFNSLIDCVIESLADESIKDAISAGLRRMAEQWSGVRSLFDLYPLIIGSWDSYMSLCYAPIVKGGVWVDIGQIDSSPCSAEPGSPVHSLADIGPKNDGEVTIIDVFGNIISGDGITWNCELSREDILHFWPYQEDGITASVSGLKLRRDWALISRNVAFSSAPQILHTYVECWQRSGTTWSFASSHDIWPNFSPLQYVPAVDHSNTLWVLSPGGVARVGYLNHWDFQALDVGNGIGDISFAEPNNGWIVGSNGNVFHYDGNSWTEATLPNGGLTSGRRVLAFNGGGAAVAGGGSQFADELFVLRYGNWTASGFPYAFSQYCVEGSAADDIWVLFRTQSTEQTVFHWTGLEWTDHGSGGLTRVPGPSVFRLHSPHEGWAGSIDGNLWHYQQE